ncbi:hypothetical protein KP509_18G041800 [Ceratopteris richardii]|uniref:Uncharacterized protein n=1 Tax=Ceratopteris richardii TaxID=49495 RepID=A0A8T2SR80_CERRI|nr:hypothetical protein KP509_18G041800 [Ceratopteris richardii]
MNYGMECKRQVLFLNNEMTSYGTSNSHGGQLICIVEKVEKLPTYLNISAPTGSYAMKGSTSHLENTSRYYTEAKALP